MTKGQMLARHVTTRESAALEGCDVLGPGNDRPVRERGIQPSASSESQRQIQARHVTEESAAREELLV